MHPIILPIAELKPALAGLGKVINPKAALPVLHHIKVERTSEGWIALTGTDLDCFVTLRLEHPAEGPPLAVLIPYDQVLQIIRNCGKDERLHIESSPEGTKFTLADKPGVFQVKPISAAEFPATPRIKAEPVALSPELRRSLHEALACASTDNTRAVLNGAFIDAANPKAHDIVATDGRHLYSANSFVLPLKHSLIIPNHKFLGWKEFNADGAWQLKADERYLQLSSRRWRFITRKIEGPYPDWRKTIPQEARTVITVHPDKLEALLKLVQRMPCHSERFGHIGIEWSQGQLLLLGKDNVKDPWVKVPVPDVLQGKGPDMMIVLDRRFLIKALQYGLNTISLLDELSPLRFYNKGRQMIVMPLRPDAAQTYASPASHKPAPVKVPRPALPPRSAPPPQERTTPINHSKSVVEEAIEATRTLRDKFGEGLNQLRELSLKLKFIHREQRTSAREVNSVRSTLRSLQGLKL